MGVFVFQYDTFILSYFQHHELTHKSIATKIRFFFLRNFDGCVGIYVFNIEYIIKKILLVRMGFGEGKITKRRRTVETKVNFNVF